MEAHRHTGGDLTYADVWAILALIDNWPYGRVCLTDGPLTVEALLDRPASAAPVPAAGAVAVRAPGVGVFRPAPGLAVGAAVAADTPLGAVEAPGRSLPVSAGGHGVLTGLAVGDGDFVEYGQPLAHIAPDASRHGQ